MTDTANITSNNIFSIISPDTPIHDIDDLLPLEEALEIVDRLVVQADEINWIFVHRADALEAGIRQWNTSPVFRGQEQLNLLQAIAERFEGSSMLTFGELVKHALNQVIEQYY